MPEPPDDPPEDWPYLDTGKPVPANTQGDPCGLCTQQGSRCQHHPAPHRPNELDDDTLQAVIDASRTCPFDAPLAETAGVTTRTFRRWKKRGREHLKEGKTDTLYARLCQGLSDERSSTGRSLIRNLIGAALSGDSAIARWLLTKMYPNDLGNEVDVNVSGKVERETTVKVYEVEDDWPDADADEE